jgi:GNAT superfamily N-acetyltransferase
MRSVLTRAAAPNDADEAVAVLRASITNLCELDHQHDAATLEQWLGNKTPEHFGRWLADPSRYLVVALVEGALSGVAALHRSGEIRLCYVKPGLTQLGVGRALLAALEVRARDWGLQELRLNSSRTALAFYERSGYVACGDATPGFGVTQGYPHKKRL